MGDRRYVGTLYRGPDPVSAAAIVLLPDWRGQSSLAGDHAGYLAGLGCTVAIADLYGDGFNPDNPEQVGPMVRRLLDKRADGVDALAACVARLRQEVAPRTPVVCLGYSAGGMVVLDYARSGASIAGFILCSALLKTAAPGMDAHIEAPVLILQGTQDQVSPMETIHAVIAEMDAAGNDVRFELYSQTHHAFDNPEAGTDPAARLVYSSRSAHRARHAIAHFIAEVAGQARED
ncbi:MAG: dienelactone hydrolase family protein [Proteobacteria bacterium]|nr:dienelactone hydrolase family protein [Pseudomonadota bacterium]HQR03678.1 dienelactone hydrolase family protein [Rhodocyclaceae bacterium]